MSVAPVPAGACLSVRAKNPWQADACRKGSGRRWRVARYPSG
ncbi:hypothetical protein [Escherichia coli]|nr:hypothetical protein [Escherichia coli]MED9710299.1 hypothetical protein [Escherichia coli]